MMKTASSPAATTHRVLQTAALAAVAAATIATAPPATADRIRTVAPGDDIVTTAAQGAQECTLGYTFTNPAGRTYGITAGHCNSHRSSRVTDHTTGACTIH